MALGGGTEAFRLYGSVGVDTKPAERGLDQLSGHVQKSGGIIQNAMGTALGFLGGAYAQQAIGAGVGLLKGWAVDYNATMEQAKIGFSTLLGSASEADKFIGKLQKFAATTPFDFPSIQQASNQLLAMGFSAESVIPTMTAVGDAVAALGGGPDMVQDITRALGKMKSMGKVNAETMLQITERGIPAWQLLADSIGKTVPEVQDMVTKGLVPADQAIAAITKGIEKGAMGGMMQAQSRTFLGAMSNITDTLNQAMGKAFGPFFDMVSKGALQLADWMGSDAGTKFFAGIGDAIGGVIGFLGDLLKLASPVIGFLVDGLGKGLRVVGAGFGVLMRAAGPLLGALGDILRVGGGVVDALNGTGEFTLGESFGELGKAIMGYVNAWMATIPPLMGQLWQAVVATVGPMIPQVLAALGTLIQALVEWIIAVTPQVLAALLAWASAFVDWIGPQIPVFLDALLGFVLAGVDWIVNTGLPMLVDNLLRWAAAMVDWVGPQIPVLLGKLGGLMVSVVGWIVTKGIPALAGAALKLAGGLVGGFIDTLLGKGKDPGLVASFVTFVTKDLVPGLLSMAGALLSAAGQLGANILKGIVDALVSLPGKVADAIRGAFANIKIDIGPFHITSKGVSVDLPKIDLPHFATGAWSVPATGPAVVHQGEMILPRDVADRLRSFGGFGGGGAAALDAGGTTIVVNIGTFYGTEANIDSLSRALADKARAARF